MSVQGPNVLKYQQNHQPEEQRHANQVDDRWWTARPGRWWRTSTSTAADVAGIDAQLVDAVFRRGNGKAVVEVDIRHQRHGRFASA